MSSDMHTLEPFPLFVDYTPSTTSTLLAKMGLLSLFSSSSHVSQQLYQTQAQTATKLSDFARERYYQYEVTFGLYMMTLNEKVFLNTIVLGIFSAMVYATYVGLQPLIVRLLCQLIYYITGSLSEVEEVCGGISCS